MKFFDQFLSKKDNRCRQQGCQFLLKQHFSFVSTDQKKNYKVDFQKKLFFVNVGLWFKPLYNIRLQIITHVIWKVKLKISLIVDIFNKYFDLHLHLILIFTLNKSKTKYCFYGWVFHFPRPVFLVQREKENLNWIIHFPWKFLRW